MVSVFKGEQGAFVGNFSKSDRLLAKTFYRQVEDMFYEVLALAEGHEIKHGNEKLITYLNRIGYVERVDALERCIEEHDFLSEKDHLFTESDEARNRFLELESKTLTERFIALGVHLHISILCGQYSEPERVYLYRILLIRFGLYYSGIWDSPARTWGAQQVAGAKQIDFAELGRRGAVIRHEKKRQLRESALLLFKERQWPSANSAAFELKDRIVAEGKKMGVTLSEQNAQRTIAEWFRKYS